MNQDIRKTINMPICDIAIMYKDDERKTNDRKADDGENKERKDGISTQENNIHGDENKEVDKDKNARKKGYMAAKGKPRKPRKTQENKAKTLRYEQETETWHCTKCPKTYSKHNAISAKSHAAVHTKEEKKMDQLAMKKREEKKPKGTEVNSGYEHCEATGMNTGGRYNQNNKWDRRILRTKKIMKTSKKI